MEHTLKTYLKSQMSLDTAYSTDRGELGYPMEQYDLV